MPRVRVIVFALVFSFILGTFFSCGRSLQQVKRTPVVTIPEEWSGGEVLSEPVGSNWWTTFNDTGLNRVIKRVLERNQDLQAAAARLEAAKAEIVVAGAAERPKLDLGFNMGRRRQNFVGFPIPGSEGRVLKRTFTNAGLSLDVGWEPDLWNRIKAGKLAAKANSQGRGADLTAVRLSLAAQAAKTWFLAIEERSQVELARSSLDSYKLSAQRIQARFERGLRSSLDLRFALTEVKRAEALLEQRLEQADRTIRQLQILMADYPNGSYSIGNKLPKIIEQIPAGLPSELLFRRPDLLAAEQDLGAADARIVEAKAQLRPSFSLTSPIGTSSNQLQTILSNELFIWSLLGNALQPIFNRGRLEAGIMKNQAVAEEAVARYQNSVLQAFNEVESALAAESVIMRREEALKEATRYSADTLKLAEQRYRSGLTDITTLLSAQRTALDSESQLLIVSRLRVENRVNLYLALGGSF